MRNVSTESKPPPLQRRRYRRTFGRRVLQQRIRSLFIVIALVATLIAPAFAGTTGGLRGRVVDASGGAAIAGAAVTATSASGTTSVRTDGDGGFTFISLAPDTYVVSVERTGYDPFSAPGISVQADQVQSVGPFALNKTLRTIASVRSRSTSSLVRPGTTSDVYSVNAATQAAAATVGGPGGLNQAYSAIATVPGANVPQGQQGWNQLVYIRGGDYSDVANELDGIPVQRASDYAPITTLSSLGQQEVQTYTGGTPPSAEASGLSGFINQVIKTGTYPGYENLSAGVGAPSFYHKVSAETSGATSNRNFSYYVGLGAVNQTYRYSDQFNGAGQPLFFFPLSIATGLNGQVYDGSGPTLFSPGQTYAIANTNERDSVANFHIAFPHKSSGLKDDVQLLFINSDIQSTFYSSPSDLGGVGLVSQAYTPTYVDQYRYHGAVFAPPDPSAIGIDVSPSSPTHVPFTGLINPEARDGDDHAATIAKIQYQKNFSSSSYLRLFGYGEYNDWFINGPVSAVTTYGGEIQDYEVHGNAYGATAVYANQVNAKNLLTATASYQTQKLETYSGTTYKGQIATNLVDARGNCYNAATGYYASCYAPLYGNVTTFAGGMRSTQPVFNPAGGLNSYGFFGAPAAGFPSSSLVPVDANGAPLVPPAGTPAALSGARNLVTENGINAQIDRITPFFSAVSLADEFRPDAKLTLNAGLRVENFDYRLEDTAGGYLARPFWFAAYNREFSFAPGSTSVAQCAGSYTGPTIGALTTGTPTVGVDPITGASLCTPGTNANLANVSPRTVSFTAFQPRLSFTYALSRDTVLRGSYGRYAAPSPTSYQQYNVLQQNLPTFIGQFLPYGFNTPFHQSRPSYSNNYDLSLEQQIPKTDVAFKLTPFYRATQDQLANIPIGGQGVLDGLNVGRQRNYGVEFQIRKGEFDRNGFAGLLSYTFTRSRVRYSNFGGGSRNEIDNLNDTIRNYNAYTSACATQPNSALCGTTSTGVAAARCYAQGAGVPVPDPLCAAGSVANPYFSSAAQPLLDRKGEYTPYDLLPSPFQGANGYETPNVATLVLNYKHNRFAFTPSMTFSSGSFYGSPLTYPGYDPLTCSATAAPASNAANTQSCGGYLFIPDKFTGKFDSFGDLREPSRLTLNAQFSYEASRKVKLTLAMTDLADLCFQRRYPWDNGSTCVYAQLPSNLLAPAGNFVANPPVQLLYPYASWYNNSQTGFVGQKLPFNAFLSADVRI